MNVSSDFEQLARLIENVSESLHREMHAGFAEMESRFADVNSRLDRIETRLGRQGALIQTGSRWVTRMNT
jgi:hypothetical protein